MASEAKKDNPTDWLVDWENGTTGWHSPKVNRFVVDEAKHRQPLLVHYLQLCLDSSLTLNKLWQLVKSGSDSYLMKYFSNLLAGREVIKVLVPLCGKTVDMMWMYKQGHTVVGVEFAEKGCVEFFTEQGLSYTKEDVPEIKGSVFKSEDERLKIYCCDFFLFTCDIEGLFDGIWDRGCFVALCEKKRYTDHIMTLMSPCCRQMIEVFEYDPSLRSDPPHSSTEEDVRALFEPKCNVQQVTRQLDKEFGRDFNMEEFYVGLYSISPKALKQYMLETGGIKEPNNTVPEYWVKRWDLGWISYHKTKLHKSLQKHYDKLLNGRTSLKILVPLCGKSLDIPWLYEKGHTVVGVEFVQKACEDFFSENGISHTKETVEAVDGTVYQNSDGRIKIYCCDIYKFSSDIEGTFDAFWDKGSYCAILVHDREKYRQLMAKLASPGFTAFVEAPEYDPRLYAGPPHSLTSEEMKPLYGDKTGSVDLLEAKKVLQYGVEDMSINFYYFVGK